MLKECSNCRWFEPPAPDVKLGQCRRNAPSASDGFPNVRPVDWCGDHSGSYAYTGRPKDGN